MRQRSDVIWQFEDIEDQEEDSEYVKKRDIAKVLFKKLSHSKKQESDSDIEVK